MIGLGLLRYLVLPAALAALLASCGGGVGSGGTGHMAGGGYGMGTITGFGSVIVDGERYDDSDARYEYDTVEDAPDAPQRRFDRADLAVGQRVELEFEAEGQTRRAVVFRVSPTLIGPVTSLSPLKVAGQTVRLGDGTGGGLATAFGGGLSSAGQLAIKDRLEVHGVLAPDGIRATRIERLPRTQGNWLRLTGIVSGLSADGTSFRLGTLNVVVPQRGNGAALQNGQRVQVWTREPISEGTLVAERVRTGRQPAAERQAVQFSGIASSCPDRARSSHVCLGGTPVALGGADFDDGLAASTLDGRYVVVEGRYESGVVSEARFSLPQR